MRIYPLTINGAYLLELETHTDERGSFARQFCMQELAKYCINFDIKQCNISKNTHEGVLRGMHYQKEPYPEVKLVSCMSGSVYDVILDIREHSSTYGKWIATELSEQNGKMLYIPSGIAHGFQTLEANSTIYYQLGEFFMPEHYGGVRWNDPKFAIEWPDCAQRIMNTRDMNYELCK